MLKKYFVFALFAFFCIRANSQETVKIYNPEANANAQLDSAVLKAKPEGKHILVQVGGNWCPWCLRFHKFVHDDRVIDSILNADYVFVLVNYSKESAKNKNMEVMQRLEFPNRFGFPVMVVLDGNGKRIHTQNSAYLEEGKSYSVQKVKEFLMHWAPKAVNPDSYKE